jgi:hypothetical protein
MFFTLHNNIEEKVSADIILNTFSILALKVMPERGRGVFAEEMVLI